MCIRDSAILRVGPKIRYRCKIQRKPVLMQIGSNRTAQLSRFLHVSPRADLSHLFKLRQIETGAICQPGDASALLINPDHQRCV